MPKVTEDAWESWESDYAPPQAEQPEPAKPRDEPCECTNCGWHGTYSERVWAHYAGSGLSFRGYLCPVCYMPATQPVSQPDEAKEQP